MTLQRVLFLPDAHTPHHDRRALEHLIIGKVLPAFRWHIICVLGDWWDNDSISTFVRKPTRERSWKKESACGIRLLAEIAKTPAERYILLRGNHEQRLERVLADKLPALYEEVLSKTSHSLEWEVVEYQRSTSIGKLNVTHDLGYGGINSTQQSLAACGDNLVIGHNHNMTYIVRGNAMGDYHVGASFGWLGDYRKIDYRHRMRVQREWVLGLGIGYLQPNGIIHLQPVPIVRYGAVIEGRLFQA